MILNNEPREVIHDRFVGLDQLVNNDLFRVVVDDADPSKFLAVFGHTLFRR